jgi:hypothetical protein
MISKIFVEFMIFDKTINLMKVWLSKIFVKYVFFDKTINLIKVWLSKIIWMIK